MSTVNRRPTTSIGPADAPGSGRTILVVRDVDELRSHLAAWERLAEVAIEANVFYEPMLLLPALELLQGRANLEFVLVYASPSDPSRVAPPILCGFFPLRRHGRLHRLPIHYVSLWRWDYCYFCCPLVRPEGAIETLQAFLDWLAASDGEGRLLKLAMVPAEGSFHEVLAQTLRERDGSVWTSRRLTRAMFRQDSTWEEYQRTALSRNLRKKFQRQAKSLAERGDIEHRFLSGDDDLDVWLEEFLKLESSGWKGAQGSAMASAPASRQFLVRAAREAFGRGRLFMSALRLARRPLAMHCDFLSQDGCFGFKAGFDEGFAAYSPGVLLDLSILRELHRRTDIAWMDSCADANHSVFNRIFNSRRKLQSLWISMGRTTSNLIVSLLPLMKSVRQVLPGGTK